MNNKLNQIFSNFYTTSECEELSYYIENYVKVSKMYYRQEELGRYYASVSERYMADCIGGFPEKLLKKTMKFAEDHFQVKNLYLFDIVFIGYSNKDSLVPRLSDHKDNGSITKHTIDYQYKSNINWPLRIDGKEFLLNNNDAVTFLGSNQMHGRPDRIFKDGEYLENIFFQFIEKRDKNDK